MPLDILRIVLPRAQPARRITGEQLLQDAQYNRPVIGYLSGFRISHHLSD